ncbi:MAG TPA: hypothetical protein VI386_13985 [Candidatus Sulfotelmatobacter sp.]
MAGLYPLTSALRDGAATTIKRQDQMILGIYISLGVFLLIAPATRGCPVLALFCKGGYDAADTMFLCSKPDAHAFVAPALCRVRKGRGTR